VIRVLVADDHSIVRRGVRQILQSVPDIDVVAEAGSGAQALEEIATGELDVVLLDLAMPEGGGMGVLEGMVDLRRRGQVPQVLILSFYTEEQHALRAMGAGAAGYVTKDSIPSELVEAIRTVASGGRYVCRAVAEKMAGQLRPDSLEPLHAQLSPRELQVLRLLAAPMSVREIAEHLQLSPKTVATYRGRILEKLGLRHTSEIVAYAVREDIVD
jgi:DNA-binding NarL/FixJ family response regulator